MTSVIAEITMFVSLRVADPGGAEPYPNFKKKKNGSGSGPRGKKRTIEEKKNRNRILPSYFFISYI